MGADTLRDRANRRTRRRVQNAKTLHERKERRVNVENMVDQLEESNTDKQKKTLLKNGKDENVERPKVKKCPVIVRKEGERRYEGEGKVNEDGKGREQ